MLLAIDIGNTNISLGLFRGDALRARFIIPTHSQDYKPCLRRIFKRHVISDAVICSVVPKATKIMEEALIKLLGKKPYIIGNDIKVPIKNSCRKPRQVGQDRLVKSYAALVLYNAPLIIVSFGTAVTFDVVSKNKGFLGGMILPGLGISLDALSQKTALLPKIKLEAPGELIGRDTKSNILSGLIYGFAGLTDGLIIRIKEKIGKNAKTIGTGGDIGLIGKYCRKINKIDRDLILKGINLLYNIKKIS